MKAGNEEKGKEERERGSEKLYRVSLFNRVRL